MNTRTLDQALALLNRRIWASAELLGTNWPHYADPATGVWTTTENGDWTGCYWAGMLWIADATDGKATYSALLSALVEKAFARAEDDTVSRGFIFYFAAALGAILRDNSRARHVAVTGAAKLSKTFNKAARIVPIGARSEELHSMGPQHVTIDGLVGTLPLFAWSAEVTCNRELKELALQDARSHRDFCVRPDGSVAQSAEFDPITGTLLRRYTHKGYSSNSTWGRAQAWAMVAFAAGVRWYPEADDLRKTACEVCDWWLMNSPDDDCVQWDFDAPPNSFRDTSASAIAAAALLKLAPHIDRARAARYEDRAKNILIALATRYLTPIGASDRRQPGILTEGCYNPHIALATRHELTWGSYYFYEALNVVAGRIRPDQI